LQSAGSIHKPERDFLRGWPRSNASRELKNATIILVDGVTPVYEEARTLRRLPDCRHDGLTDRYDFAVEVSPEDSQAMMLRSLVRVGQNLAPEARKFQDSPSALGDNLQGSG
jgi:hypothetical protein